MSRLLLAASAILAVAYGFYGYNMYGGPPPYVAGTIFKAASIVLLGAIALMSGSRLLAAALLFGALGDALLAWRHETFLYGSLAFLIGHLCYITLFLGSSVGARGVSRAPWRIIAVLAIAGAALVSGAVLVPHDSPMFVPLAIYSTVLAFMTMSSLTLPVERWLAMVGAVLFFISDGFVAWNMFHHDPDPTFAFWRSFAGWMIYWGAQAALCFGALGLAPRARFASRGSVAPRPRGA